MNPPRWIARRRMAALTKAVYDSALNDDDEPPEKTSLRLLPGAATVAALVTVLVLLACVGVWRHAAERERGSEQDGVQESQQSEQRGDPRAQEAPHEPAPASSTNTPTGSVIVYVSGAVATPGVLTLPASSRVVDAITAAGGALAEADLDTINLARPLVDGEHIRVPTAGQVPASEPGRAQEPLEKQCVRLDTATASDLQTLPGIGPALAARIIDYRASHPHIASVDALDEVPGIGPALIEKIRPGVCP